MANVKISQLPEASAGTVLNTDTIVGVFNGITKKCILRRINLDLLTDGTTRKAISATEKGALAAGYVHLQQLADAEAATALWDYNAAAKMPPSLLKRIV